MKIEAVLFDLDGTLIDSEPLYETSDKLFLQSQGITIDEQKWPNFVGMGSRAFIQYVQKEYGLTLSLEEGMRLKDEAYKSLALKNLKPFDPVLEFARAVKAAGKKSAVASGSTKETIEFCVDLLKIGDLFDLLVSANEVKHGKPEPDIFLYTADQLGVKPQNCLVLEDSVFGVESALRAGMRVLAFPYVESLRGDPWYKKATWLLDGDASSLKTKDFIGELKAIGAW